MFELWKNALELIDSKKRTKIGYMERNFSENIIRNEEVIKFFFSEVIEIWWPKSTPK